MSWLLSSRFPAKNGRAEIFPLSVEVYHKQLGESEANYYVGQRGVPSGQPEDIERHAVVDEGAGDAGGSQTIGKGE